MSATDSWVAAGHPATVAAAEALLAAGGNAYDAVIAAAFAAGVAEPGLSSLGGGGFLLAATAAGEEVLVDFFVDTPGRGLTRPDRDSHFTPVTVRFRGAEQVFHAGYASVASPGCLAGFLHAHRRFGRRPLAEVVAPARDLARGGVALNEQQAEIFELLHPIFTLTPEGRRLFTPGDRPLSVGDTFTNPELADLLDEVATGRVDGFGDPRLAEPLARAMADAGGLLTPDDLTAYQVVERTPLRVELDGAVVLTNPRPSFGGTLVGEILTAADRDRDWSQPPAVAALVEAMIAAGDGHAGRGLTSTRGTTHISVADGEGNLAALTTSNGSCSGVFAPGTGVQLNNIMGEADLHPDGFHTAPAGLRVGSMMSPSVVRLGDGRRVVLGSGGSERIRTAIALTIGLLARGTALRAAVEHPRVHWDGTTVQLEPGWPGAVLDHLRARWPVNVWTARNLYFGGVHAVSTAGPSGPGAGGDAAGDPRRGGSTARVSAPRPRPGP